MTLQQRPTAPTHNGPIPDEPAAAALQGGHRVPPEPWEYVQRAVTWPERLPPWPLAGLFAVACVAVAAAIVIAFHEIIDDYMLSTFLLAALLATWYGGLRAGMFAAALSALVSPVIIEPFGSPAVEEAAQLARVALVAFVSGVVCVIFEAARQSQREARELAATRRRLLNSVLSTEEQHRAAEEALRSSEQRYRDLAEAMPQLVWTATPEGVVDYYNAHVGTYGGLEQDAATRTWRWQPLIHPDDLEATSRLWERAAATGDAYECEHRLRMANGGYRWHISRAVAARDDSGKIVKWFGTAIDIDELRRTQDAVRGSEERYRAIFEDVGVSIWEEDFSEVKAALDRVRASGVRDIERYVAEHPDFVAQALASVRVRSVNEESARMFAAPSREALAESLPSVFVDDSPELFKQELLAICRGERTFSAEAPLRRLDGSVFQSIVTLTFPAPSASFDRVLVTVVDVTERRADEIRARLLASVATALAESRDTREVLAAMTDASHEFADAATFYALRRDGSIERLALSSDNDGVLEAARYPIDPQASIGVASVLRTGHAEFYPTVPDELLVASSTSEEHLRAIRALPWGSAMFAPVRVLGEVIGCVGFGRLDPSPPFTGQDFELGKEVGRRVGLAMENQRLLEAHSAAVAATEAARDQLATVTNAMPALISYVDRELRYQFTNEAYEEWFGEPPGDIAGRPMRDVVGEAAFGTIRPYAERALAGERTEYEAYVAYRTGPRWIHATYIPDVSASGDVLGFFVLVNDISERRRMEEAVRESERQLSELLDALPAIIITSTPEGHVTHRNRKYFEYTGVAADVDPDEWAANGTIPDEDMGRVGELVAGSLERGEALETEFRFRRHDGEYRRHYTQSIPIRGEGGTITRWVAMMVDIEDQRSFAEALQAAQVATLLKDRQFQTLLDLAPVGIAIAEDASCRVIRANRVLERMLHLEPGANASKSAPAGSAQPYRVLREGVELQPDEMPMQRAAATGEEQPMERLDVVLDDGSTLHLYANAAPILDDEGTVAGVVSAYIDMTEMLAIQDQLRAANAAKDEFLSLVSHELKTPITTVVGNAELLFRRGDRLGEENRQSALTDIRNEGERLHRIIENLLILARLDQGQTMAIEPLLVARMVRRIVEEHARRFPMRKVDFEAAPEALSTPVMAVESYIDQIVGNLLSNAEKYSALDGPISVRVAREDNNVVVRVLDRGIGITDEDADRLFTPFYRSPRVAGRSEGVGIGLAVCKRLVEAQDGQVWARPRAGGGTEMGFTLPAAVDDEMFEGAEAGAAV